MRAGRVRRWRGRDNGGGPPHHHADRRGPPEGPSRDSVGPVRSGSGHFAYLKGLLQLTDGNLGRHLEILAGDGLIIITKGYEGRRPRTWAEITRAGDRALAEQVAAMKQLVTRFERRQAAPVSRRVRGDAAGFAPEWA
jgi:hypothetical protein